MAEGFYGKIPSRGDFVRAGLPREFVEPWDAWLSASMEASRAALGERWLDIWLEAPVWRFLLPSGVCGPLAALGVWLPSIDRAGRHFPLTLVATSEREAILLEQGGQFLARAEAAGLAALQDDLLPDALAEALALDTVAPLLLPDEAGAGVWWTNGSPRLEPQSWRTASLPGAIDFADMLCSREELG